MDRDWGEHSHHRSTGRLLTYIEKGALLLKDLTEGINKFIYSLDKDSEGDLFQFRLCSQDAGFLSTNRSRK
jgi:hypothetical protein